MNTVELYDAFSADYDRFVDWKQRLAYEWPFLDAQLSQFAAKRVLDAACGTGQHAIAMAHAGYRVDAADLSAQMVARAQTNAAQAGASVQVHQAGFGEMLTTLGTDALGGYDAITCLGNSIPHILTQAGLDVALRDMAAVLSPGGVLIIQQRNFDRVLAQQLRFMPPESQQQGNREWLFMRFYDWEAQGRLAFNVVRMERQIGEPWQSQVGRTWLYPWTQTEITEALAHAGFRSTLYGSLAGDTYDAEQSSDLVAVAVRDR